MATSNFSVLVDLVPDVSSLKKKLKNQNIEIKAGVTGTEKVKNLNAAVQDNAKAVEDAALTWQQYREMLNLATRAIESFVGQTMEMDESLTEFKKVSTLSGNELDRYVNKLSEAGKQVARTGKPNRSEPVCCDGKAA